MILDTLRPSREECVQKDLCFYCKKSGHNKFNCSEKQKNDTKFRQGGPAATGGNFRHNNLQSQPQRPLQNNKRIQFQNSQFQNSQFRPQLQNVQNFQRGLHQHNQGGYGYNSGYHFNRSIPHNQGKGYLIEEAPDSMVSSEFQYRDTPDSDSLAPSMSISNNGNSKN